MKTESIILQTLCVPCNCHCRYCLLSWDNRIVGAEYERSKCYARDFYSYIRKERPEIQFDFAFGYCMEHPNLLEELDFLNEIGSGQGQFLQMDGMKFRSPEESVQLMKDLKKHGVKAVNFTFYGLEDYHDRFAGRPGDFTHLLTLAQTAIGSGLEISVGIPLTAENTGQVEFLTELLENQGITQISLFVPHEEGRGKLLAPIRFSEEDFAGLGSKAVGKLNRKVYKTEREWITSGPWPTEEKRALIISLTPENIGEFEKMTFDQAIHYVENLDEKYYAAIPDFGELCRLYGNPSGTKYYRKRDLYQHYQKQFLADHNRGIYDVTDERFCGSRRY